jgi:hypothetical protein
VGGRVWHQLRIRHLVEKEWIGRFCATSLDLSGLVENSTARGVFFTQLEFSSHWLP